MCVYLNYMLLIYNVENNVTKLQELSKIVFEYDKIIIKCYFIFNFLYVTTW